MSQLLITQTISINLEDRRNKKLRDPDTLLDYIDSKLTDYSN